jgi:DNA-binding MarR family transcriptional regulator
VFNDILDIEEKALIVEPFCDITVKDMHIIEAVGIKEPRTMSQISKSLGVTMGTLTIGMNGLVKKGYVKRNRGEKDRRIVYAVLTDKGVNAYEHHMNFHRSMVESVMGGIKEEDAVALVGALQHLEDFFIGLKEK